MFFDGKLKKKFEQGIAILCISSMLTTSPLSFASDGDGHGVGGGTGDYFPEIVERIDITLLNEAKNKAGLIQNKVDSEELVSLLMKIQTEWIKVQAGRERRQAVEQMVRASLNHAVQGLFTVGQMEMNDVTNRIIEDDLAALDEDLVVEFDQLIFLMWNLTHTKTS